MLHIPRRKERVQLLTRRSRKCDKAKNNLEQENNAAHRVVREVQSYPLLLQSCSASSAEGPLAG